MTTRFRQLLLLASIPLALAVPIATLAMDQAASAAAGEPNQGVDPQIAIGILGNTAVAVGGRDPVAKARKRHRGGPAGTRPMIRHLVNSGGGRT